MVSLLSRHLSLLAIFLIAALTFIVGFQKYDYWSAPLNLSFILFAGILVFCFCFFWPKFFGGFFRTTKPKVIAEIFVWVGMLVVISSTVDNLFQPTFENAVVVFSGAGLVIGSVFFYRRMAR